MSNPVAIEPGSSNVAASSNSGTVGGIAPDPNDQTIAYGRNADGFTYDDTLKHNAAAQVSSQTGQPDPIYTATPGSTNTYTSANNGYTVGPDGKITPTGASPQIDTGNPIARFQGLNDDNSTNAKAFDLGGSPGAAAAMNARETGLAAAAENTQAPTIDMSGMNAARNAQQQLGGLYQAQLNGTGPSASAIQTQIAMGQNQAAANAAGHGGNALAQRNAMTGLSNANQNTAVSGANGRAGETATAAQQYGGLLGSMSSNDINTAGQAANMQENQNAINDQLANNYLSNADTVTQLQNQGQQARAAAILNADQMAKSASVAKQAQNQASSQATTNDVLAGATSAAAIGAALLSNQSNGGSNNPTWGNGGSQPSGIGAASGSGFGNAISNQPVSYGGLGNATG